MSTAVVIIFICCILLLSYFFDLSSAFTKIPSVILLIGLGIVISILGERMNIPKIDLSHILPVLGTFGLILIVLSESLELELNKEKIPLIKNSFIVAIIPMLVLGLALMFLFVQYLDTTWHIALVNAIPLVVISSAIAIPSVHHLALHKREFVIYESSLSDILGVVLFNLFALNEIINGTVMFHFTLELMLMILISLVSSVLLSFLLSRIKHHVKFVPIVVLLFLIYAISKIYHLPALIFVLLFGLFLGNLDLIKNRKFNKLLHPKILDREVKDFRKVVAEATFVVKTIFFVVFGYLIEINELLNLETFKWSLIILVGIYLFRAIQLKVIGVKVIPLLFIAPRGLITILLFLAIPMSMRMPLINESLVIQVIIMSILVMMIGMFFYTPMSQRKNKEPEKQSFFPEEIAEQLTIEKGDPLDTSENQ